MGCCSKSEDVNPEDASANGDRPVHAQKCRDCICVILFAVFWVGMLAIAIVGLKTGDPHRLLFGTDYLGNTCGASNKTNTELIYYPRMNDDLLAAAQSNVSPLDAEFYGLCVSACPDSGSYICNYEAEAAITSTFGTAEEQEAERKSRSESLLSSNECWFVPLKSDVVFFRCFPETDVNSTSVETCIYPADDDKYYNLDPETNARLSPNALCEVKQVTTTSVREAQGQDNPLVDKMQTVGALIGRWMGDIKETYVFIFGIGAGVALVAGCVILLLLKFFAGCIIWFVCWGLVAALLALTLVTGMKGGVIPSDAISTLETQIAEAGLTSGGDTALPATLQADESRKMFFEIASYVSAVLTIILFMVVCFMRKKIKITIGIVREASKAVSRLPLLILFPVIPFVFITALFIYWVVIASYIYSSGGVSVTEVAEIASDATNTTTTMINGTSISTIEPDNVMRIMFAYHFFGFLWTNNLIQAISMTTMAGAYCRYYWSREKTSAEIGKFPIMSSLKNCFRYSLGSLIFGSFIIAVVQFIRAVMMYIDKQTKDLQRSNLVLKVVMKLVHCCLWCLEKCIKFLSKNAYIMIAMKGKSFCGAAKDSFFTILANVAQVGVVAMVSNLLLLLSKLTIAVSCAILMFFVIDSNEEYAVGGLKELASPVIPILLTLLLSWFVASSFMGVYEMAIDTILICFCEDKKINATSGAFYMSDELQQFVESSKK